jgi:hypothetical protein
LSFDWLWLKQGSELAALRPKGSCTTSEQGTSSDS